MAQAGVTRRKLVDLKDLEKRLSKNLFVVVGFPKGQQNAYPDGTSVASVAYINEYGSTAMKIPSRPFMRRAMARNKDKYGKILKDGVKRILDGKSTPDKELKKLGLEAKNDVQMEISRLRVPENAPSTVEAKGSNKPLIDTGHMRQSVYYEIRKKVKGKDE